jgi:hypothetical protein
MKRSTFVLLAGVAMSGGFTGCQCGADVITGDEDMAGSNRGIDYGILNGHDLWGVDFSQVPNPCGDFDPSCMGNGFGPPMKPFPLGTDPQPDPNEGDEGVGRDPNGYIVLSNSTASFNFLWLANTDDWGIGSVAKIDSKKVIETARYFTVTCYSNPGGSRAACDGTNGCCSRDDFVGYTNRKNNMPAGPHQAINTTTNYPSRTAVDFNGDVWVSNRAFGVQSSVTKIANDINDCTERNGTPGIQTSSDVNGDGVIDTDCNADGVPDDIANVKAKPCSNGKAQEFFGFDDECVLFTTNTDSANQWGRPLCLGQGSVDFGPSDAWAGLYNTGNFFRIDGASGLIKAQTKVPVPNGTGPYGAAVDQNGIAWVTFLGNGLAYFDTNQPQNTGSVRLGNGVSGYGISLDRDQNIWTGGWSTDGNANRYTPDRSNGFAKLGMGYWTIITGAGDNSGATGNGRGIAADSRTMADYWVWMARDGGWISRIPASTIAVPKGADQTIDGHAFLAMQVAGTNTIGAGVDIDQNIWGISYSGSVATRIKVDVMGNMTKPDINGGNNNMGCPVGAGDRCTMGLNGRNTTPDPYTYSDFTGFGLRNFTNPKGYYSYIQKGCQDGGDTHWINVIFDADVPPNTKLTMRARSGPTPVPDNSWGAYTGDYTMSPADLKAPPGPLMPNPAPYIQVEFDLSSMDRTATPKLKSFSVDYECSNIPG